MHNKKAQVDMTAMLLTVIIVAVASIVGLVIFSKISNTSNALFPADLAHTVNESVTITVSSGGGNADNSTLLAKDGYISNSEVVVNGSTGARVVLTRDVDYRITLLGGASGELPTRANFTLINVSNQTGPIKGFNDSELKISYDTNEKGAGRVTKERLDTTVLDSFSLGIIGLLVLAAVVIVGSLAYFYNK